jgi:hypothetical protein
MFVLFLQRLLQRFDRARITQSSQPLCGRLSRGRCVLTKHRDQHIRPAWITQVA